MVFPCRLLDVFCLSGFSGFFHAGFLVVFQCVMFFRDNCSFYLSLLMGGNPIKFPILAHFPFVTKTTKFPINKVRISSFSLEGKHQKLLVQVPLSFCWQPPSQWFPSHGRGFHWRRDHQRTTRAPLQTFISNVKVWVLFQ